MIGLFRTISLIVITVLVTIFFIQNLATAEVAFLTWSIAAPRSVIFALIFALGWAAGFLVHALSPRSPARRRETEPTIRVPSDT